MEKDEFLQTFDFGLPQVTDDAREASQKEVLLLYHSPDAIPSSFPKEIEFAGGPLLSVEDATQKCTTLNVVSIGDAKTSSELFLGSKCLALVGHEQMYHVQRFVKDETGFRLVQRETIQKKNGQFEGRYTFAEDSENTPARLHWAFLSNYLPYMDTLRQKLKTVLENIAIDNTVIVMVCNLEQSTLLVNFACACRARGIATSNLIVFATDQETAKLATELNFASFYDKEVRRASCYSTCKHCAVALTVCHFR